MTHCLSQDIAKPLFFQKITLCSQIASQKLVQACISQGDVKDSLRRWTKSLIVTYSDRTSNYLAHILAILPNIAHLEKFKSYELLSPAEIMHLQLYHHMSLYKIEVQLFQSQSFPLHIALVGFSKIQTLRQLNVSVLCQNQVTLPNPASFHCIFPRLKYLEFLLQGQLRSTAFQALSLCRFTLLNRFFLAVGYIDQESLRFIGQFFAAHQSIHTVHIILGRGVQSNLTEFLSMIGSAGIVRLCLSFVPKSEDLPCIIQRIGSLVVCTDSKDDDWAVFDMFQALFIIPKPKLKLHEIKINTSTCFCWEKEWAPGGFEEEDIESQKREHREFVGQMLVWSIQFQKLGIRILDKDGNCVRMEKTQSQM